MEERKKEEWGRGKRVKERKEGGQEEKMEEKGEGDNYGYTVLNEVEIFYIAKYKLKSTEHSFNKPYMPYIRKGESKQRIYGRRISNGRKTFKDMLNILTHQRNANQNNSEIPSYTCQNG
ncbi:hypothetical protein STEG23_025969 [Scotinomys teguina]